jgi:hypothetical protein
MLFIKKRLVGVRGSWLSSVIVLLVLVVALLSVLSNSLHFYDARVCTYEYVRTLVRWLGEFLDTWTPRLVTESLDLKSSCGEEVGQSERNVCFGFSTSVAGTGMRDLVRGARCWSIGTQISLAPCSSAGPFLGLAWAKHS